MSTISEGLLAGFRIAALREELQASRAERAEFEATRGYRDLMRSLEQERVQADLRGQEIGNKTAELQRQLVESQLGEQKATAPARTAGAYLDLARGRADLSETRQRTKLASRADARAERTSQAELSHTRSLTQESQARTAENRLQGALLERELAGGVGRVAGEIGLEDFARLAQTAMEAQGVKFKEGDAAHQMWTLQIQGQAEAMQRELADNKRVNALNQAAATAGLAQQLAGLSLGTVDPEATFEVYAQQFKDQPELVAGARALVQGELQTQREREQGLELSAAAERQLTELYTGRNLVFNQIAALESKEKRSVRDNQTLRELKNRLSATDAEITKLREGLLPKKRERRRVGSSGLVRATTQEQVDALQPGTRFIWTDGQEYTKQ